MKSLNLFLKNVPALFFSWSITRYILFLFITLKLPYPEGKWLKGDVELYDFWSISLVKGIFPISDSMWQYPPIAGFVISLAKFLFGNANLGFIFTMLLFDLIILIVLSIYGIYENKSKDIKFSGLIGSWFWVIWPIFMGPLLLTRFDLVPTLFAVLSLIAIYHLRIGLTSFLITVGTLIKLWPLLLISIIDRKYLKLIIFLVSIFTLAILIFTNLISVGWFSFLDNQSQRGLQVESVAAIFYVILGLFGLKVEYPFRYGSLEVNSVFANQISMFLNISTLIFFIIIFIFNWKKKFDHLNVFDKALIIIVLAIGLSRVFSPQFYIWLGGLSAVALIQKDCQTKKIITFLSISAVFSQILYPGLYVGLLSFEIFPTIIQLARILFFIFALGLGLKLLFKPKLSKYV